MAYQNGTRYLSEWQWQQLVITTACLRDMNRQAELQLRNIEHSFATSNDYRQAAELYAVLGIEINATIDFREEVLAPDPRTAPNVTIRISCRDCHPKPPDERLPEAGVVLKIDPEHRLEVDALLELAQRVSELVLARHNAHRVCSKSFFTHLSCLRKAMLRQSRHLRQLDPGPTPKVQCLIDPCSCGRSTEESTGDQNLTSPRDH
jgi:hypothetical protein